MAGDDQARRYALASEITNIARDHGAELITAYPAPGRRLA
jgi:hypothetical protein